MSAPLVSVVIPCRSEVKSIEGTVRALLASQHPNLEVLVVDGMSEDGTRDVVARLQAEDPRVRLIDNPKKLTPYAFNLGVTNARGAYIQIVGSRNRLEPDYIPLMLARLNASPEVACVGGDFQHVHDSPPGEAITRAMESKFGVGGSNYRTMSADTYVDTVGVPLYRRAIFNEIGLFDENLTRNQDDEFNFRVRRAGYKILYVHQAKTTYLVRGSLRKAFKQYQQYGYFKVYVNKKHGAMTTYRQLVPALFLGFWAATAPGFWFAPRLTAALWLVVAALYVFTGLKLSGRGLRLAERWRVLKACFVLHLGYGSGYWLGIWDFLVRHTVPRASMQSMTT